MNKLVLNAPAKINIGLNIVSRRDDGFHNLETFFYPIYDLHDKLIFESSANFIFDSDNTDLIRDPDNLITKAHTLVEEYLNRKLPIKITLEKIIPIGAGMGGGSSDAAATLIGLNEFFELNISYTNLIKIALELGSDVPFFIKCKPAVGRSRGEFLTYIENYIKNPILIINPGIHISTKEAFSNIKPQLPIFDYRYFEDNTEIDLYYLSNNITNDFENYIFNKYPAINKLKLEMINSGALFSSMSGTGSTVYGIFNNIEDAEIVLNKFPDNYFKFISH